MKLKDVRKAVMNGVMDSLRSNGPMTEPELLRVIIKACPDLGSGTAAAALTARLEELVERAFIVRGEGQFAYYAPSERMFDDAGNYWIGHKLIDLEWPPYYGKEKK